MSARLIRLAVLALASALWIVANSLQAAAQQPQALVVDVQPRAATQPLAAGIVRGGAEQRLWLSEPLYSGDQLFAREVGARVVIDLPTGKRLTIDASVSNYTVQGDSDWLAYLAPAFASNMHWSNSAQLDSTQKPKDSQGRGEDKQPLAAMPSVRDPLKFVAAGGPLWVGWRGGVPPFKIVLTADAGEFAAAQACNSDASECAREVVLGSGQSLPPTFTLTVTDAAGAVVTRHATTLSANDSPAPVDSNARDFDQFTAVVAIVDHGGGRAWGLEAGRRLVPLARSFPPARAMLDGLRDGQLP